MGTDSFLLRSGSIHVRFSTIPPMAFDVSSAPLPPCTFSRHRPKLLAARVTPVLKPPLYLYKQPPSDLVSIQDRAFDFVNMASDQDQFRLVSPQINREERLPRKYTQEGQGAKKNISPPLEWYNGTEGTKSLALVVEDVDAPDPSGPIVPWTHWWRLTFCRHLRGLPEGFSGKEEDMGGEYEGIKEGNNDWKVPGWRGPMLPSHGHRFQFKLYALDDELDLGNKVTKEKVPAELMAKF